MEGRLLSTHRWTDWLRARSGEEVDLSVMLSNTQYGTVRQVAVAVGIAERLGECWRLDGVIHAAGENDTHFGPMLIQSQSGLESEQLMYVSSSTRLLEEDGNELAKLPDRIVGEGVRLPYSLPGGTSYYVDFRMKLK